MSTFRGEPVLMNAARIQSGEFPARRACLVDDLLALDVREQEPAIRKGGRPLQTWSAAPSPSRARRATASGHSQSFRSRASLT